MMGEPGTIEDGGPSEAELAETCEQAAERLAQCVGETPPEFVDACTHDPDEDAFEAAQGIASADCDDIDPDAKADGLFAGAFARVCSPVVQSAYLINRRRNPSSEPMTAAQRRSLRPVFGGYVDHANVHWDAALIDSWEVAGVELEFSNTAAMAFGHDIFVASSYRPNDISQLALMGHELTHTWQAARLGSISAFAEEYCRGFYNAGFSYYDNDFEVEARDVQDYVRDCLRDGTC